MGVVALSAIAAGALILFLADPATASFYPRCPFHALTGLFCPGCGSLRAAHQLLHGHLLAALRLNPLTVVGVPLLAYVGVAHLLERFGGRLRSPRAVPTGWMWAFVVMLVSFGVVRNLPGRPWDRLAPPRHAEVRQAEEAADVLSAMWQRKRR
jgi:hypothetical protein